MGVGPVSLHGHCIEPLLPDQAFRDLRADTIELMRAMGCLPKKDNAFSFGSFQQRVKVRGGTGERYERVMEKCDVSFYGWIGNG